MGSELGVRWSTVNEIVGILEYWEIKRQVEMIGLYLNNVEVVEKVL